MTPLAALLPHEQHCPDCEDGKVPVTTRCVSSAAEQPEMYTGRFETCRTCDGTHIVVNERRDRDAMMGWYVAMIVAPIAVIAAALIVSWAR